MRWAVSLLWIWGASAAFAQEIEFWGDYDSWEIEIFKYDDGSRYCVASTVNTPGYLALADDGLNQRLIIQRQDWSFDGTAALQVEIDGGFPKVFSDVPAQGNAVYIGIDIQQLLSRSLIEDMLKGDRLLVKTSLGEQDWPLNGFSAALAALPDCAKTLVEAPQGILAEVTAASVAEQLELPKSFRDWTIETTQDGTNSICVARVQGEGTALSIFGGSVEGLFMRFTKDEWTYDQSSADVRVQVDRSIDWTIENAKRNQSVIDVALPESTSSESFVENLQGGNWVYLYASNGVELGVWSLAGSRDGLDTWTECVAQMRRQGS